MLFATDAHSALTQEYSFYYKLIISSSFEQGPAEQEAWILAANGIDQIIKGDKTSKNW